MATALPLPIPPHLSLPFLTLSSFAPASLSLQVLGVIEEVFSKEASQQLQALEAQAAAEAAQAAAASQDKVAAAGKEAAAASAAAASAVTQAAAAEETKPASGAAGTRQTGAAAKAAAAAAKERAEEEVAAIQSAIADQAGEAVASVFVQVWGLRRWG